ncbi:hypothetical protein NOCA2200001 [metagenome]|uniref:Uncharacterized protein n=1 Tax=metagenome TaxID=256318 RepID=A0A2P2BXZ1_9ZZZZ
MSIGTQRDLAFTLRLAEIGHPSVRFRWFNSPLAHNSPRPSDLGASRISVCSVTCGVARASLRSGRKASGWLASCC